MDRYGNVLDYAEHLLDVGERELAVVLLFSLFRDEVGNVRGSPFTAALLLNEPNWRPKLERRPKLYNFLISI